MRRQYHKNNNYKTIKEGWNGNPLLKGRYIDPKGEHGHGIKNILKWRFSRNPQGKEKRNENWNPEIVPIYNLDHIDGDAMVWLGHNSFYLQIAGKRIMFDPVFGHIPFVRRKSKFPAEKHIFKDIDYLLISHDHYDHADKSSVSYLCKRNPGMTVISGLGTDALARRWCRKDGVKAVGLGWYQQYQSEGIKITFLPSKHWGKRSLLDKAKRLWGAFMIEANGKKVYYSGDTGYGGHFSEVHDLFGRPDYALIGIGAYKPRWFMKRNHISPHEALDASRDMGAGVTVPMHYGTFNLSDEPFSDPPKVFKREAKKRGVDVLIPKLGEVVEIK